MHPRLRSYGSMSRATFALLGLAVLLLVTRGTALGEGGRQHTNAGEVDPAESDIPSVIVGSPSGLARPFSFILRNHFHNPASISETWLSFEVESAESQCGELGSPKPYTTGTDGDELECENPTHANLDWPYNELGGNSGTFHPRFGGRGELGVNLQFELATSPWYTGITCIVARSTDFDSDGDTDQADKLEIGHEIASGSPDSWYNLDTDDVNNTTINGADYMVVVNEMLRGVYAGCNCDGVDDVEPECDQGVHTPVADASAPDTTSIFVGSVSSTALVLKWRSPGDDYDTGQKLGVPKEYDLRYSNSAITSGNFASATRYTGTPTPSLAGTIDAVTIDPRCVSARYWAIKTIDFANNTSSMSAVLDLGSMTTISTMTVCGVFKTCALIGFAEESGSTYDIRYSISNLTESNFCAAASVGTPTVDSGIVSAWVTTLTQGQTYYFAARHRTSGRWSEISNVATVTTPSTGPICNMNGFCLGDWYSRTVVTPTDRLDLASPRPSPTGTMTAIAYSVPEALGGLPLDLSVYNVAGRKVTTLVHDTSKPGAFSQGWNLQDARGADVRPGVYFVRMTIGDRSLLQRLVVDPR